LQLLPAGPAERRKMMAGRTWRTSSGTVRAVGVLTGACRADCQAADHHNNRRSRFWQSIHHCHRFNAAVRLTRTDSREADSENKNRPSLEENRKRHHFFRENRRGCNDWARREHSEGFCIRPNACKVRANCPPQAHSVPLHSPKSVAAELPVDSPSHGL
jgi:hypothetical protein